MEKQMHYQHPNASFHHHHQQPVSDKKLHNLSFHPASLVPSDSPTTPAPVPSIAQQQQAQKPTQDSHKISSLNNQQTAIPQSINVTSYASAQKQSLTLHNLTSQVTPSISASQRIAMNSFGALTQTTAGFVSVTTSKPIGLSQTLQPFNHKQPATTTTASNSLSQKQQPQPQQQQQQKPLITQVNPVNTRQFSQLSSSTNPTMKKPQIIQLNKTHHPHTLTTTINTQPSKLKATNTLCACIDTIEIPSCKSIDQNEDIKQIIQPLHHGHSRSTASQTQHQPKLISSMPLQKKNASISFPTPTSNSHTLHLNQISLGGTQDLPLQNNNNIHHTPLHIMNSDYFSVSASPKKPLQQQNQQSSLSSSQRFSYTPKETQQQPSPHSIKASPQLKFHSKTPTHTLKPSTSPLVSTPAASRHSVSAQISPENAQKLLYQSQQQGPHSQWSPIARNTNWNHHTRMISEQLFDHSYRSKEISDQHALVAPASPLNTYINASNTLLPSKQQSYQNDTNLEAEKLFSKVTESNNNNNSTNLSALKINTIESNHYRQQHENNLSLNEYQQQHLLSDSQHNSSYAMTKEIIPPALKNTQSTASSSYNLKPMKAQVTPLNSIHIFNNSSNMNINMMTPDSSKNRQFASTTTLWNHESEDKQKLLDYASTIASARARNTKTNQFQELISYSSNKGEMTTQIVGSNSAYFNAIHSSNNNEQPLKQQLNASYYSPSPAEYPQVTNTKLNLKHVSNKNSILQPTIPQIKSISLYDSTSPIIQTVKLYSESRELKASVQKTLDAADKALAQRFEAVEPQKGHSIEQQNKCISSDSIVEAIIPSNSQSSHHINPTQSSQYISTESISFQGERIPLVKYQEQLKQHPSDSEADTTTAAAAAAVSPAKMNVKRNIIDAGDMRSSTSSQNLQPYHSKQEEVITDSQTQHSQHISSIMENSLKFSLLQGSHVFSLFTDGLLSYKKKGSDAFTADASPETAMNRPPEGESSSPILRQNMFSLDTDLHLTPVHTTSQQVAQDIVLQASLALTDTHNPCEGNEIISELSPRIVVSDTTLQTEQQDANETKKQGSNEKRSSSYGHNDFYLIRRLGKGKHSEVFLAQDKHSGFLFAVKQIYKEEVISMQMEDQICQEIRLQMSASHKNVVSLYGFMEDENYFYLFMEYAPDGEMSRHLSDQPDGRLSEQEAAFYLSQLADALNYLHSKNIVHRDLKPDNLLLSNGVMKLADFGYSTICESSVMRTTFCGTLDYLSPKVISGEKYGSEVDVWSFGVLAYEFLQGVAPFYENTKEATMQKIINGKFKFVQSISDEAAQFILSLLTTNPNEMLSMRQVANHPWLKQNAMAFMNSEKEIPDISLMFK